MTFNVKKYRRIYYKKNRKEILERNKRNYARPEVKAYKIRYQRDNWERIKEYRKIYYKKYVKDARIKLLNFFGGKCVKCGFNDWRALQIDHKNGGGCKELKKYGSNSPAYIRNIKINNQRYQLLCANCNWIKRYENNELNLLKV